MKFRYPNIPVPPIITLLSVVFILLLIPSSNMNAQSGENGETLQPILVEEKLSNSGLFGAIDDLQATNQVPESIQRQINSGMARTRITEIHFDLLYAAPSLSSGTRDYAEQITLNLFEDISLLAVRDNLLHNPSGSYTWVGHLQNDPLSTVLFVHDGNQLYGTVQSSKAGEFAIQPLGPIAHAIQQTSETSTLPEDDTFLQPELAPLERAETAQALTQKANERAQAALAGSTADDGSLIDVLVVHSDDVNAATAQNLADLFIAYTNLAYEKSEINQRVWLVDVQEFTYNETGSLNSDLSNITSNNTPDVRAHRNEYHADLVLFFVNNDGSTGSCSGLAWLQTNVSLSFQSHGFAAMKACSYGAGVFAHELGHNMGARHDWYMDSNTTPYSYAHGYVDPDNAIRTIMSYSNRCSALGISCTSTGHFANPDVTFNGAATGIAGGSSSSCSRSDPNPSTECDADVRRTFNNTAANTSQFRDSQLIWTGAANSNWSNSANWQIAEGVPGSTTNVNRAPRAIDNVIIPAGVSNMPTLSSGSAAVRELIIENGATLNMTGGTLTVGLRWEDAGGFQGSGGTVIFNGPFGIEISTATPSTFPNLQIGDGSSTPTVALQSDIDINGNILIKAGALFEATTNTIHLAGNWSDEGNGFVPSSSTVIFDGNTQSANKVTSSTLLDENFADADNQDCCNTTYLPNNWTRESGWYAGDIGGSGAAAASSTGWLFSAGIPLQPGINYTVQFDARRYSGSNNQIRVYYGAAQSSGAMTTLLDTITLGNSYSTYSYNFSVNTSEMYYIGFYNVVVNSWTLLDNVLVTGGQALTFYNLQVASGTTTFNQNLSVNNNLIINNGATANLSTNAVTVDGTVTNNGALQQTNAVPNGSTTKFLHIQNKAGSSNKYYGVEITPAANMGNTFVTVYGNQACAEGSGGAETVQRCFEIVPANVQAATIRFYYTDAEANGESAPNVYHWTGSQWALESFESRGGSGNALWVIANGIDAYSPFRLDDGAIVNTPTPTNTPVVNTPTETPTNTPVVNTPTETPTNTPVVNTPTETPTNTPVVNTPTETPTNTPVVNTPTETPTNTPVVNTPTGTLVPNTPTFTPTYTPTSTPVVNTPTLTPTPTATEPVQGQLLYLSSDRNGRIGSLRYRDEDILLFDTGTQSWSIYLDGSDIGLGGTDIDAFQLLDDGTIIMSLDKPVRMILNGERIKVDDSDLLRFTPSSLGENNTSGSFELIFQGADVDLKSGGEDIDAVTYDSAGNLMLSVLGSLRAGNLRADDEDIVTVSANNTLSLFFDGSDMGINSGSEDITGLWLDGTTLYFTTKGNVKATGSNGDFRSSTGDIIVCELLATGETTSCNLSLFFAASTYGLRGAIDGLSIGSNPSQNALRVAGNGENALQRIAIEVLNEDTAIESLTDDGEIDLEVDAFDLSIEDDDLSETLFIPFVAR